MSDSTPTKIVKAGRRKEWTQGIVNPPVYRASTILFEDVAAMRAAGAGPVGTLHYGRSGTPTQWSLAEAISELEPGAAGTKLFPSGVAAIAVALMTVLRPGDELLMADCTYGPTRKFCDTILAQNQIATTYYDPLAGADIERLIGERTRAIFMETPGSLTMEIQDVPAICNVARAHGIATLLDNTWATPLLFPALGHGVDLTILACTKYVGGHSDVMLGSVTANYNWWEALDRTGRAFGQQVSPDDAYLTARGLRTLGVRLHQHQSNALEVAGWLDEQPQVARILHPAFHSCPGHEVWARDFFGSSGLFSIVLNGGDECARDRFVDALEHFGIGYSWGGFESLALPVDLKGLRTVAQKDWEGPLVRLHIGLEDAKDLIADLAKALADYPRTTD